MRKAYLMVFALTLWGTGCAGSRKPVQSLTPPSAPAPAPAPDKPAAPSLDKLPAQVTLPKPPPAPVLKETEKKLDQHLLELMKAYRSGGDAAASAYAGKEKLTTKGSMVKVDITAGKAEQVEGLKKKVGELHGEPITEMPSHLFAYLPFSAIEGLSQLDEVWSIAIPGTVSVQQPQR